MSLSHLARGNALACATNIASPDFRQGEVDQIAAEPPLAHAIAWVFARAGLSPCERLIALAVAQYADADGLCRLSVQQYAHVTEMTHESARRCLHRLEAAGVVRIVRRGGQGSVFGRAAGAPPHQVSILAPPRGPALPGERARKQ